jgi:hypothetical protein
MDRSHRSALRRALSAAASRRGVIAALTAVLLVAGPLARLDGSTAARKRRKSRRRKQKRRRKDRKPRIRQDATCAAPSPGGFFANDGSERFAQAFRAEASGPLVSVELVLLKIPGTIGDWLLRLAPVDDAGFPTNDVLAETAVADDLVPDFESTATFIFAEPATLRAGATYALVATRPDASNMGLGAQFDAACDLQGFTSLDQTSPFLARPELDFIFTTFVRSRK